LTLAPYSKASQKGKHAILLYLLTNELKIEVSVDESGAVPAENYIMRDGAAARLFDSSCSLPKIFKYYTPENTGLCNDNPIIVVDDYQEDEKKKKHCTLAEKFSDMLKKTGANSALISYFESHSLAQKFKKGLNDSASLSDDERV
jgi:hypothetical protein